MVELRKKLSLKNPWVYIAPIKLSWFSVQSDCLQLVVQQGTILLNSIYWRSPSFVTLYTDELRVSINFGPFYIPGVSHCITWVILLSFAIKIICLIENGEGIFAYMSGIKGMDHRL